MADRASFGIGSYAAHVPGFVLAGTAFGSARRGCQQARSVANHDEDAVTLGRRGRKAPPGSAQCRGDARLRDGRAALPRQVVCSHDPRRARPPAGGPLGRPRRPAGGASALALVLETGGRRCSQTSARWPPVRPTSSGTETVPSRSRLRPKGCCGAAPWLGDRDPGAARALAAAGRAPSARVGRAIHCGRRRRAGRHDRARALGHAGLDQADHVLVGCANPRAAAAVRRALGGGVRDAELDALMGHTGAAHVGLLLADALDRATRVRRSSSSGSPTASTRRSSRSGTACAGRGKGDPCESSSPPARPSATSVTSASDGC